MLPCNLRLSNKRTALLHRTASGDKTELFLFGVLPEPYHTIPNLKLDKNARALSCQVYGWHPKDEAFQGRPRWPCTQAIQKRRRHGSEQPNCKSHWVVLLE